MYSGLSRDISPADLPVLEKIYIYAFPPEERRPWQSITHPDGDSPQLHAILADGRLAGLLTLWRFDSFAYIEHLAIDDSIRGSGLGSAAVRDALSLCCPMPIVVEIEPPTDAEPATQRRLEFYRRLGFEAIDRSYVQPPYNDGLPSVSLHLLATAPLAASKVTRTLHSEVYGKKD